MTATLTQILGNSGEAFSIEYDGKTYKLSVLNDRIMNAFEIHLFKNERRRIEATYEDRREQHVRALQVIADNWRMHAGLLAQPVPTDVGDLAKRNSLLKSYADAITLTAESALAPDDAAYAKELKACNQRFERGEFGFEGPICQSYLQTPSGRIFFGMQMLGCKDRVEMIKLMEAKGTEIMSMLALVTNQSLATPKRLKEGDDSKN
jgi:hypothetical protein